jgi:hypothetical protein
MSAAEQCPENTFQPKTGGSTLNDCIPCVNGHSDAGASTCTSNTLTIVIVVSSIAVVLVAAAVWRWYKAKTQTDRLLLDIQEMGEVHQFEEPLLSAAPEPLKKAAVVDMGGMVTDLVMIGGGAFGTHRRY